uniref:Uncharacterized protein n=1 Tax=Falco tinnunculus TaxID=100819 RepID=A0A8C4U8Q5_FALTI
MCNIIYIYHLQAIYKDVNSKAYLLRLSSFLIYIYTIVHLIYFFFNTVFNTTTSSGLSKTGHVSLKKVTSDSSEIFCHC